MHFDYRDCRDYLQAKYNYAERDYGQKYCGKRDENAPYLDFWHWVIANYEIHNGCFITFSEDMLPEIQEDWIRTIYGHYLTEFAKEGELEMYISW
jgi:hypothetical protein